MICIANDDCSGRERMRQNKNTKNRRFMLTVSLTES